MNSDISYTNNKIFIDSKEQSLTNGLRPGSEYATWRNFNNGSGAICTWLISTSFIMPTMNVGYFRIYNRALTADEVRQNYLATKERYA